MGVSNIPLFWEEHNEFGLTFIFLRQAIQPDGYVVPATFHDPRRS